jgi:hypothetical protein
MRAALVWGTLISAAVAQTGVEWKIDSLDTISGIPVTVYDAPSVVEENGLKAVMFDGVNDGIHLAADPLGGATTFTLEVWFYPASGGGFEQRFFHVEEVGQDRMLLELRSVANEWYLDTFVQRDGASLPLIDDSLRHAHDRWYHLAAVYDGTRITSYVNGVEELNGTVALRALNNPTVSLGVRQNLRSWFKGSIAWVKSTPAALTADEFTTPGAANSAAAAAWLEVSTLASVESFSDRIKYRP